MLIIIQAEVGLRFQPLSPQVPGTHWSVVYWHLGFLLTGLSVVIAASIYTDRREELHRQNSELYRQTSEGTYGYSFILAWVAFAFTFISGLMYLILRKRK